MKLPQAKYTVSDDKHKYTIKVPAFNDPKLGMQPEQIIGPLKSVTGVLNVIDKPALKGWAARESAAYFKREILRFGVQALNVEVLEEIAKGAASAHTKIAKDAADLGSKCHDAFEAIILGKEPEGYPAELEQPIKAFKEWRLKSDIEIVDTETAVASLQHRFGGRLDAIGYSKSRGGWGIVDYKTSSGFYGNEYAYQAGGGYAIAVEEQFGIEILWSEIIRFAKKAPYESEGRPVLSIPEAKAGFLNALNLTRSNDLKLIGEPTFTSAGIPKPVETKTATKKKVAAAGLGF